ncbi:hypothetical protein [Corynebacterium terpenotabidum]|uniref:Aromatic ring-opening dioxygenase LigA n=1 Tax=Corynebacterium terpenotabidum Y-11 TaxID=1200352 RepID=S4XI35_9CORY|nr:hypothetical protein [Corynebacterium terpenotabidum]AGP30283.1 hypothetical protein A606_03150 [Corynebacterium terpenotabidum Y-11]
MSRNHNAATRRSGRATSLLGYGFIAAGVAGYATVRQQLLAENITVHEDVKPLAGRKVADPVTAYAQADIVNKHALAMTGGKPFAELPMDSPQRETVFMAANVRSSLLTSVLSFGVSGLAVGTGVIAVLAGRGIRASAMDAK